MIICSENFKDQIINSVNIPPRLVLGIFRRLYQIQMNSIGPEISAAHEHNYFGFTLPSTQILFTQSNTLVCAHGPIVKVEVKIADLMLFFIPNVSVSVPFRISNDYRNWNLNNFMKLK